MKTSAMIAAAVVVAASLLGSVKAQQRPLVPALVINPLETNEVHKRAAYVTDVLLSEPLAAADTKNEDFQPEENNVGIDDATLMGIDSCEPLPSEKKSACQLKREARLKKEAAAAAAAGEKKH